MFSQNAYSANDTYRLLVPKMIAGHYQFILMRKANATQKIIAHLIIQSSILISYAFKLST